MLLKLLITLYLPVRSLRLGFQLVGGSQAKEPSHSGHPLAPTHLNPALISPSPGSHTQFLRSLHPPAAAPSTHSQPPPCWGGGGAAGCGREGCCEHTVRLLRPLSRPLHPAAAPVWAWRRGRSPGRREGRWWVQAGRRAGTVRDLLESPGSGGGRKSLVTVSSLPLHTSQAISG